MANKESNGWRSASFLIGVIALVLPLAVAAGFIQNISTRNASDIQFLSANKVDKELFQERCASQDRALQKIDTKLETILVEMKDIQKNK